MNDNPKKPQKLKARKPRGLEDRDASAIVATRRMVETISKQFELYGFEPVETPAIEYTDALGKFLPDQDRPNEGVFSFQDDDEQWLSLRYDLTAPLARYVAENFPNLALPYRSYRHGWVFRNEKPGPGRFRQFMQFDADTVGSASPAADAEMCMLAADTMEALGIKRGQYVVKVNNRKVLDGVREAIGVAEDAQWLTVMRAIDKLDRLGVDGVRLLLGLGRKDDSGDFAKGAGLNDQSIDFVLNVISSQVQGATRNEEFGIRPAADMKAADAGRLIDNFGTLAHWSSQLGGTRSGVDGIKELEAINAVCEAAGYGSQRIVIDPSVVRGLEYYTGPVYEVELLLDTKDDKGRPVRFGSVGGGGRYDGLVSRFMGQPVPATGFSIGVSRLMAALALINKGAAKSAPGPVLVTVMDQGRIADYQKMVATLRGAGIRAELYLGSKNHNLGQQLKYADKRNSPCAVIQGSDEKAKGQVTIKDLALGAELSTAEGREEHLKKQAQAQVSVSEDTLVAEVTKILARR
jgi:histidyl-tRNA synthetase